MSFKGKVIIVTGASSGIGAVTAVQFTKEGANVVLVGRNETKLNKVARDCENSGLTPLVLIADVSKEDDAERIIKNTLNSFGHLDVLVNNAAFGIKKDFLGENILQAYDAIMSTNVRGLIYLCHLAAPHLIASKGNIVNISSGAALMPVYDSWAYCTSKAAVDHFSRCLALELSSKGVRVNVVSPGPVRTDFMANLGFQGPAIEDVYEKLRGATMLDRVSDAIEIADVILFLAGDKAKGITGSNFIADNGCLLKGNVPRTTSLLNQQ